MPRYSLRTLLILLAAVPPVAALAWLRPVVFGLLVALFLYIALTLFVLGIIRANPGPSSQGQK